MPTSVTSVVRVASSSASTDPAYGFSLPTTRTSTVGVDDVGNDGSPAVWVASARSVLAPAAVSASSGRYVATGSSSRTSPRVTASASSAAVNVFVIEPSSYGVSGAGGAPSTSPSPANAT